MKANYIVAFFWCFLICACTPKPAQPTTADSATKPADIGPLVLPPKDPHTGTGAETKEAVSLNTQTDPMSFSMRRINETLI
jgi:hypothetical protein